MVAASDVISHSNIPTDFQVGINFMKLVLGESA